MHAYTSYRIRNKVGRWSNGSAAKSTYCCSSKGLELGSQHQASRPPDAGDPMPSSLLKQPVQVRYITYASTHTEYWLIQLFIPFKGCLLGPSQSRAWRRRIQAVLIVTLVLFGWEREKKRERWQTLVTQRCFVRAATDYEHSVTNTVKKNSPGLERYEWTGTAILGSPAFSPWGRIWADRERVREQFIPVSEVGDNKKQQVQRSWLGGREDAELEL